MLSIFHFLSLPKPCDNIHGVQVAIFVLNKLSCRMLFILQTSQAAPAILQTDMTEQTWKQNIPTIKVCNKANNVRILRLCPR